MSIRFESSLVRGTLLRRYKRFLADVRLKDGSVVVAHTPNSGSMATCFAEQCDVALTHRPHPSRKLHYTWELSRVGRCWVGVNTERPNRVVEAAIRNGLIPELGAFDDCRREVPYGTGSRIDLLLESGGKRSWIEVKNVTLKDGSVARFPDSVTERGTKHLRELEKVARRGDRAVMIFFVNRPDCSVFSTARNIDPTYGAALDRAVRRGVEVLALATRATLAGIEVRGRLPIDLAV